MKTEHLLSAMNSVSDDYLLDARQPASAKKAVFRPLRIAIIAACLCAALVGGTFAAEAIFGIPIFTPVGKSFFGEPWNGFTTIIELPGEAQQSGSTAGINGVSKLPVEAFSRQARDTAAALKPYTTGQLNFNSWESAEAFLGMDLMNNPVLARAEPGLVVYSTDPNGPTHTTICSVDIDATDGILSAVRTSAVYFLNRVTEYDESGTVQVGSAPVRLDMTVQSYTTQSLISPDAAFMSLGFPEDYTFTPETYTTPGGLVVSIVGVSLPEQPAAMYYAQFALNGSAFTIHTSFMKDGNHALSTLKEVLDAFQ